MSETVHPHQQASSLWTSRMAFILAAAGSAVGLGNIWKFPYITGENGGGAFLLCGHRWLVSNVMMPLGGLAIVFLYNLV